MIENNQSIRPIAAKTKMTKRIPLNEPSDFKNNPL